MATAKDRQIIKELAAKCAELAQTDENKERFARARSINNLNEERPIVWIEEVPWHEMDVDGKLELKCEDGFAREMETFFRGILFRWEYFKADMIVRDAFYIQKAYDSSGVGLEIEEKRISAHEKGIAAQQYTDVLSTPEQLAKLKLPKITARPDVDKENIAKAEELLGGAMPVRLEGHAVYHAPWDRICRMRGAQTVLFELIENPDFMHAIIDKYTQIAVSQYEQMEAQNLLGADIASIHCTPSYVDGVPAADYDGTARLKDVWFRGTAQLFSSVSPAMHKEFELDYARRIMERCAYSYYGCCEPLDKIIYLLKEIPNMRKIGVSPWADVQSCAEQIGGSYVMARKPNPAFVAGNFSEEIVEDEIKQTLEAAKRYGCPCEFVLKDISTVGNKPQNLFKWNEVVQKTIDRYY